MFLPEASDYIGGSQEETISLCKPASESPFLLGLQQEAKKFSLPISVGVHEPSDDPQSHRIKNTLLWINADGEIAQRYQKIHLFDLEIENGPIMRESAIIEPGSEILQPFDTAVGKIGSMICFDLRFPEIALALKRQKADLLLYPSAFTVPTGKAHWLSLLRARAIECECYVIAAAQVGNHSEKRVSYGHSVVIDPVSRVSGKLKPMNKSNLWCKWGEVLAELGGEKKNGPEVIFAEIDFEKLNKIRKQMPLLRRT